MRVTIVLDPQFGTYGDIPAGEAFWLVESPTNRRLSERLRAEGGRDPNSAVFRMAADADPTETVLRLWTTLEDHHPTMTEAVIVGYAQSPAFETAMHPFEVEQTGDRVVVSVSL